MKDPVTLDQFLTLVDSIKVVFKKKLTKGEVAELAHIMMDGYRLGFIEGINKSIDTVEEVLDDMSKDCAFVERVVGEDSAGAEELLTQSMQALFEFKHRFGVAVEKIPLSPEEQH